ncbi:hypothetical protein BD324DRAFT_406983 [Kockovaella imperatae]|uniref:Aminoglycoside phosphotransferase domain-containing protein n=1 Tax=Kockovaella imperatae TaxID=4999 RepID=A0A1Y1UIN9_9TREE|nr:hypothetical protein BD324DRAFT_406983 [Kockovaella imperatae]ORX37901.1 hypothetical protein BD324DRAFT_406983 [Kockovaella imperatae]
MGAWPLPRAESPTDTPASDQWTKFHQHLDKALIEAQATSLRPGHACVLNASGHEDLDKLSLEQTRALMEESGDMRFYNHHFPLIFDDGVKWIVRCRRLRRDRPSYGVMRYVLDSEIITMEELRNAGVCVPRAYRALGQDEDTAQGPNKRRFDLYFFVEYVDAMEFPLAFLGPQKNILNQMLNSGRLTCLIIRTFVSSYAEQMIKLSRIHFDAIGSLHHCPNRGTIVGPMIDKMVGSHSKPYFHGPFRTAYERWTNTIDYQLDLVLHHEGYDGDPITCYLSLLDLRDLVEGWQELKNPEEEFYIRHCDSKADQCFTDPAGNIIAWIDWEWAAVTTKAEAFASPLAFRGEGISDKMTEWETLLAEAYVALGRKDLAECVRNARRYHWLEKLADPASGQICPPQDFHAFRMY